MLIANSNGISATRKACKELWNVHSTVIFLLLIFPSQLFVKTKFYELETTDILLQSGFQD